MRKGPICYCLLFLACRHLAQTDSLRIKTKLQRDTNEIYTQPLFSTSGSNAESDLDEQDVSSLLQSSRDLFTQLASFQWSASYYRLRGYTARNQLVMINGVNVNDPATGTGSWSSWGGLNDVARFAETRFGNVACPYGFSAPGGYTNMDVSASSFKKGTRITYAASNRAFRNRMLLTHSIGLMKNNWAFSFSTSVRSGNNVKVLGTYIHAYSFYVSLSKRLNAKQQLTLTGFAAPAEKGLSAANTQEVYELTSNKYYNSLWGYQNGRMRNASVSKTTQPMLLLSHVYSPDPKKKMSTTFYSNFGKSSLSGLNYLHAANPRPDYYKYLPNYFYERGDEQGGSQALYKWENDINTQQINWDRLIAANRANLYSQGQNVNTTETRARYILEKRIESKTQAGFNIAYTTRKDNLVLSLGANGFIYKNRKYKQLEDPLGATFWIDVDQFAENLGTDPMLQQNDISRPDRKVYKDGKFGYDHTLNINHAELWANAEYAFKRIDAYAGLSTSESMIWRSGWLANGKFPLNSKGNSDKTNFLNYGFKAGVTYKLNGRNFISGNLNILSRAPQAANLFVSPDTRNTLVDDIRNEELVSSDISYIAKYPGLKLRLTLYNTRVNGQTWLRSYYDDSYHTLVNMIMTNVNQQHQGFELALEKTFRSAHSLQIAAGFAQSRYTNQPKLQAWQDNTNSALFYNRRVYLKNYHLGGSPQLASAVAYRYSGRKNWSAGICLNYFDGIYVEINPNRRTAEAAGNFQQDEQTLARTITAQEKLPSYFLLNFNAMKKFRLRKKYSLNLNVSVNNVLNKRTRVAGYEQLRWDPQFPDRFATKYIYGTGITYLLSVNLSF